MIADDTIQRQILLEQVLDATTLPEIHQARQTLREWITAHPDEQGLGDAFEQLSLLEDIAQEQQTEQQRERELQPLHS